MRQVPNRPIPLMQLPSRPCKHLLVAGHGVSFQITILKVLAGHPGGRLSAADLTRCVSILISSGSDWSNRTKRLAARAPSLDIFSQSFVSRDSAGWQITEGGRAFLVSIEAPCSECTSEPVAIPIPTLPVPVPTMSVKRRLRRRRRAAGRVRNVTAA